MKPDRLFSMSRGMVLLAALAAPLCAQSQAATEAPMTAARFSEFVRLVDSGDARHAQYLSADATPRTEQERKAVLRLELEEDQDRSLSLAVDDVYIDDQKNSMAVVMAVRQTAKRDGVKLGARPEPVRAGDSLVRRRIVFVGLANGKISSLRLAGERELPPPPAPLPPADESEPMPETVNQPVMTKAKFEDYALLFSRWDKRFVQYYDPDVIFDTLPAQAPVHGRQGIIDLYIPFRRDLDEHITVGDVVVDSAQNVMIAEIRARMVAARADVKLPTRVMKKGSVRDGWGVIKYDLKDGRISRIRSGGQTETFEPRG